MMLSERRPILLANARIIDPSRDIDIIGDLLIADGMIREAKRGIGAAGVPEGTEVIDCRGKVIAPGLIDMRAFIGEPGAGHRETFASASQAAAAGGVTTIICQPDTSPVIDDPATVDFVLRRARDTAIVHVHPMAAISKGLHGKEMTEIGLLKAAGAVAFTDGDKSIVNAQVMRRALTYARDFGALIMHETQDRELASAGVMNEGLFASWLGLPGIPREAELIPLQRDLMLARLTRGNYHAAKISTAMSADAIATANIHGFLWSKLAYLSLLWANVLVKAELPEVFDSKPYRPLLTELTREVIRVAGRRGIALEPFDPFDPGGFADGAPATDLDRAFDKLVDNRRASAKKHSGMWRDIAVRKRKTEADTLLVPMLEAAQAAGIATPLNTRMLAMVRELESGTRRQGWHNFDELSERLC